MDVPSSESHDNTYIKYLVCQLEEAASGYIHWQGYVEFTEPTRWRRAQALLGGGNCWLGKRRGTREQARDYCTKQETRTWFPEPFEIGVFEAGGQGRMSGLSTVIQRKRDNPELPLHDAIEGYEDVFVRHSNGLPRLFDLKYPQRRDRSVAPTVIWLYGASGIGKTRAAWDWLEANFPGKTYQKESDDTWWDGYKGQPAVLIDEAKGQIPITLMLKWLDRYPCDVRVKGGTCALLATTFVLTSIHAPTAYYGSENEPELNRRISKFIHMEQPYGGDVTTLRW